MHQIFFGNSSTALTPRQLSQIQFHNPEGGSGTFPAMIRYNGEMVPARFLHMRIFPFRGMVLEWPDGETLQTATNVLGPYLDLPVTSPYLAPINQSRQFFRLKQ